MTRNDLIEFVKKFYAENIEIMEAKNKDYGADEDPFANFRRVEALGIASAEQGFLTRMTDKLSRITSFVNKGELHVKDESVTDTLQDLANYCGLMAAYIKSKSIQQKIDYEKTYITVEGKVPLYDKHTGEYLDPKGVDFSKLEKAVIEKQEKCNHHRTQFMKNSANMKCLDCEKVFNGDREIPEKSEDAHP